MQENLMWVTLSAFGGILLFTIVCFLGSRITQLLRIQKKDPILNHVLNATLGTAAMGLTFFALGVFGSYTKTTIGIVLGVALLVSITQVKEATAWIREGKETLVKKEHKLWSIIILIFTALLFIVALSPETEWDAISYHLSIAKIYVTNQAMVSVPYAWHAAPPHLFNMLYIVGEMWHSDIVSRVFVFLINMTAVVGTWGFARRYINEKAGVIAAAILLMTPILLVYFPTSYIDIPTSLFVLASVWTFWEWKQTKKQKWLIAMAVAVGTALTTKLVVAGIVPILVGAYIYFALQEKERITKIASNIIIIGAIIAAFFAPWWIFNYVHLNNPLYPWAEGIFHGKWWSPELTEFWGASRDNYLNGTSWVQFFLLPITFTFMPNVSGPIYGFTPLYLIFIPLMFLYQWKPREKSILWFILVFLCTNTILWFIAAPDWRYMFFLFPFLAMSSAYAIAKIQENKQSILKKASTILILIVLVSSIIAFIGIFRADVLLVSKQITREEFKAQDTQNYYTAQFANKNLPQDAIIFLGYDDKGYYFDRAFFSGNGEYSTYVNYLEMESGSELYERLKQLGVTHIVTTLHHGEIVPDNGFHTEHIRRLYSELLEQYTTALYEENESTLYELKRNEV